MRWPFCIGVRQQRCGALAGPTRRLTERPIGDRDQRQRYPVVGLPLPCGGAVPTRVLLCMAEEPLRVAAICSGAEGGVRRRAASREGLWRPSRPERGGV